MYLLDTNVVSELRKARSGKADPNVVGWAKGVPAPALFLSAISVLELEIGILLIERRDEAQGQGLRLWFEDQLLPAFDGRILAIDTAVVRRCAQLHMPDPGSERDMLIAATALAHSMTVVTRNVADFRRTGVIVLNPWDVAA